MWIWRPWDWISRTGTLIVSYKKLVFPKCTFILLQMGLFYWHIPSIRQITYHVKCKLDHLLHRTLLVDEWSHGFHGRLCLAWFSTGILWKFLLFHIHNTRPCYQIDIKSLCVLFKRPHLHHYNLCYGWKKIFKWLLSITCPLHY